MYPEGEGAGGDKNEVIIRPLFNGSDSDGGISVQVLMMLRKKSGINWQ
jgi:hypothetical protein